MKIYQVGDFVDIGRGPQEVRFVNSYDPKWGDVTYELARPDGRTPLQTISHAYLENLRRKGGPSVRSSMGLAVVAGLAGGMR